MLILGHRGYSARHLENSMEAFRAALDAGMDGFELDVQPTLDGVCAVLHDGDLRRTAQAGGILREMSWARLPRLNNGERIPRLEDVLQLPARLINVELKGRPGWRLALHVVKQEHALDRVLFSSFAHPEIFKLRAACPTARCGLLWTTRQANALTAERLEHLSPEIAFHLPLDAVRSRAAFWAPYRERILLWGIKRASEARTLSFMPAIIVADAL